ncbi:DUF5723 family protein [Wenyingzhuangia sp. IMCC45533]
MIKYLKGILILFVSSINAQTSIGFIDNFSGIQSVIYNPSNIVDTFYKTDINLFSGDLNAGNDAVVFNPFEILGDVDFKENRFKSLDEYIKEENFSKNSSFYTTNQVLGPSVLINLDKKTAISFTSAIRTYASILNIDADTFDKISSDFYDNNPQRLLTDDFSRVGGGGNIVSWAEIGFTYAKVLLHQKDHFFKYGVSLKFLRGIRAFSVSLDDFNSNLTTDSSNPLNNVIDIDGDVNLSYSSKGANYGQSIDIGLVYEKRNRTLASLSKDKNGVYYSKAPYQYKLSVAVTDIGFLSFNNTRNQVNRFDLRVPSETFNLEDHLNISNKRREKTNYILPTTAHINFDYYIKPHWYVNLNLDLFLLSNSNLKQIKSISTATLSARYESQHFSAFLPMSINRFGVFKSGIGFRTGYFFLGSSSFFTNLTNLSKEADVFLGFKIPIYHKKVVKEYKDNYRYHVSN